MTILVVSNLILLCLLARGILNRPKVRLEPVTSDIPLDQPLHLSWHPQDDCQMFVVQKVGVITRVDTCDGESATALDMSDIVLASTPEEGMLSLAFDPAFESNQYVYIFYSLDEPKRSRVARMKMRDDLSINRDSELKIVELEKHHINHNGGMVAFGGDGYLYASFGDSFVSKRSVADVLLQDKSTFLGTIIRIDVSDATEEQPYTVPQDNPFAGLPGVRPEIWAYGLRNPWRFTFAEDGKTIIVGDVGGNRWEEVNVVKKGGQHFGWPIMEGEGCRYSTDHGNCDRSEKELPVGSFSHDRMIAINGGQVYQGDEFEWLQGQYIFSDYHAGIFAFEIEEGSTDNHPTPLALYPMIQQGPNLGRQMRFSSSAVGPDKEMYFTSLNDGVYRIKPISGSAALKGALYEALRF